MSQNFETIRGIVACPSCRTTLTLRPGEPLQCPNAACRCEFGWVGQSWELIPPNWRDSSVLWSTWEHLQVNGQASYREDPEHNLGVGNRPDYLEFSRFCAFAGYVLDVGCGPQSWPTHFQLHDAGTVFVGVDPLVGKMPAEYVQLRALAEYLPFQDQRFDHVVFATSLDHFVEPVRALTEAKRVCRASGEIDIWIGEKSPDAPRPATSPAWYQGLERPAGADDLFHLKRLTAQEIRSFIFDAGLEIAEEVARPIDPYRTNYFLRLRCGE